MEALITVLLVAAVILYTWLEAEGRDMSKIEDPPIILGPEKRPGYKEPKSEQD